MLFKRPQNRHVVILGNGIAGVTTALALRRRDRKARITIVSGETEYFYSRPALMYLYMGHMRLQNTQPYEPKFWRQRDINLHKGWVERIDLSAHRLMFSEGGSLDFDQLVIATGSQPNKFGWPGQDLKRVHGLYSLQDLASLEAISDQIKHAVIVGGGLIGIELAEMLHSRGKKVTILSREQTYWDNAMPREESVMVGDVINAGGIELRSGTELKEIQGDAEGRACAVVTGAGDRIECQFVGLTAGVRPNIGVLKDSKLPTGRGVLCDFNFRTQDEDVFTCGDCAEIVTPEGERNRIEQLWYTGKMHGEVLGAVLAGEDVSYDRGIWFNSAKFLDLEWHTYGQVPPAGFPQPPGLRSVYWENKARRLAFRLVLDTDGAVVGVNAMGIRYRHRVCERWIAEKRPLDYVLSHLSEGNFDPEFYRRYEAEIVGTFQEQSR
ncbi:MAG: NAD(P)/FAD-dependent oxidoreductase [Myxococcales bacterium]|nr:NAD(P)/FAD-dependent oxidoreductase [Myxococcales bacterium]